MSWYVYSTGSSPTQWSLPNGAWHRVTGIVNQPSMWGPNGANFERHGTSVFVLLDGCRDTHVRKGATGSGLFISTLKAELHGIGQTLEAHLATLPIDGVDQAEACGYRFAKVASTVRQPPMHLRLNGADRVTIDRWQ